MTLRPEERAAIDDLMDFLARERSTEFDGHEGADPPDWVAKDRNTGATIAIEHTRIEPYDKASKERWQELRQLVEQRAKGVVPGIFVVGPALPNQQFPTPKKKLPLEPVAQDIVDAIKQHAWATPYETWEVSPTAAPLPRFWARVMYVSPTGSDVWGTLPLSHKKRHELVDQFRGALERKTADLHARAPDAGERIILVDVTKVHAAELGSYVEHVIDVMETLRLQAQPTPSAVHFQSQDAGGRTEITRIWLA